MATYAGKDTRITLVNPDGTERELTGMVGPVHFEPAANTWTPTRKPQFRSVAVAQLEVTFKVSMVEFERALYRSIDAFNERMDVYVPLRRILPDRWAWAISGRWPLARIQQVAGVAANVLLVAAVVALAGVMG